MSRKQLRELTEEEKSYLAELSDEAARLISAERAYQNSKWGIQRHSHERWFTIAMEEVGEVAEAMLSHTFAAKDTDSDDLIEEVVQTTAVFKAFLEQLLEERDKHVNN